MSGAVKPVEGPQAQGYYDRVAALERESQAAHLKHLAAIAKWTEGVAVPGTATTTAPASPPVVRTFASGANRDVDTSKFDYEAFLSPEVLWRFGAYMHKNRFLRDGSVRDGDNWQKGIPIPVYMKSLLRHVFTTWRAHRAGTLEEYEEELCAILFNTQGMLLEILKKKGDTRPSHVATGTDGTGGSK